MKKSKNEAARSAAVADKVAWHMDRPCPVWPRNSAHTVHRETPRPLSVSYFVGIPAILYTSLHHPVRPEASLLQYGATLCFC